MANMAEGVIIADARRRIVAVNRAFTSITGYTEAEVVGGLPRYLRRTRDQFPLESRFFHPDSAQATKWAGRLDVIEKPIVVNQIPPTVRAPA